MASQLFKPVSSTPSTQRPPLLPPPLSLCARPSLACAIPICAQPSTASLCATSSYLHAPTPLPCHSTSFYYFDSVSPRLRTVEAIRVVVPSVQHSAPDSYVSHSWEALLWTELHHCMSPSYAAIVSASMLTLMTVRRNTRTPRPEDLLPLVQRSHLQHVGCYYHSH